MLSLFKYVWQHPLNAGARVVALARVLRWQIASRLISGPIALPYVEGTYLFARRGMTGATGNWYCGLHEVQEMAFVLHLLRPDDKFMDIGANIGSYTVLAAGAAGARVTAVEPIPSTFLHLTRNVALNDLAGKVRCHQLGLSNSNGSLCFSSDLDTVNHVLTEGEDIPCVEVPISRLDDLCVDVDPLLIIIDVEGHERAVLEGGARTLGGHQLVAVIMETNGSGARYGIADQELAEIMLGHGFEPYGYDPFGRQLIDADGSGGNTLFVRDRAMVDQQVQSARRFKLVNGEI